MIPAISGSGSIADGATRGVTSLTMLGSTTSGATTFSGIVYFITSTQPYPSTLSSLLFSPVLTNPIFSQKPIGEGTIFPLGSLKSPSAASIEI